MSNTDETTPLSDSEFATSEKLRKIDSRISEIEERLAEVERERGQVTSDSVEGVEGAEERLDGLHGETDRLQRELRDLKAARETESKRLAEEHSKAVQKANAERLELLEGDRKALLNAAKKVDQKIAQAEAALSEFHSAAKQLDGRRHEATAVPFGTEHVADEIARKLMDLARENHVRYDRPRLEAVVPSTEAVSDRSYFPAQLDEFTVANSA